MAQYDPMSASLSAQGGAGIATNDPGAGLLNQACWTMAKGPTVSLGYNSRFMLKELSDRYLMALMPVGESAGVLGLNFNQFGYSQFNITKAGLGFARTFGPAFSAGLQFDAIHAGTGDEMYGSTTAFTFEGGFLYKLSNQLAFGTTVFNPVNVTLNENTGEQLPSSLTLGMSYTPDDKLMLAADIMKEQYQSVSLRTGFRYQVVETFALRGGFSTTPFIISGGAGIRFGGFTADIATSWHQILGISPAISLTYQFAGK